MKKNSHPKILSATVGAVTLASILTVLAQSNSLPVLTISSLGNNQTQVSITNGVAGATYELWWVPILNNPLCQWSLIQTNGPGQTNFDVDGGLWATGFFRVRTSQNYGGIWDYQLANPSDPSLGALSITIDSPTNGTVFNQ